MNDCLPGHHKFCGRPAHSSHHDLVLSFAGITRHYKMEAQKVCQVHCGLHEFLEDKHTHNSLLNNLVLYTLYIFFAIPVVSKSNTDATHPYKVINSSSSFPCGKKCSEEQHLKHKMIRKPDLHTLKHKEDDDMIVCDNM